MSEPSMRLRSGTIEGIRPRAYDEYSEYENRFNSFSVETITELLREDMEYITLEECDEEYFRKTLKNSDFDNNYKKMYMELWLSQQGHVSKSFGVTSEFKNYPVYLPSFDGKVIMKGNNSKRIAENEAKGRFLKRVEYNLKAYHPHIKVLVKDLNHDGEEIFKRADRIWFYLSDQPSEKLKGCIHLWEDRQTSRGGERALGRRLTAEERAEYEWRQERGYVFFCVILYLIGLLSLISLAAYDAFHATAITVVIIPIAVFLIFFAKLDMFDLQRGNSRAAGKYLEKLREQDEQKRKLVRLKRQDEEKSHENTSKHSNEHEEDR